MLVSCFRMYREMEWRRVVTQQHEVKFLCTSGIKERGERRISTHNFGARWSWTVNFTLLPLYLRGKNSLFLLNRSLDEPQGRSYPCRESKPVAWKCMDGGKSLLVLTSTLDRDGWSAALFSCVGPWVGIPVLRCLKCWVGPSSWAVVHMLQETEILDPLRDLTWWVQLSSRH